MDRYYAPGDEGWDEAVLVWNGMVAMVPGLVLQPTSARDVAVAVECARDHRLLLGVKGGGHNIAGIAIADRGLTLDMSRMRDITVDPAARLGHVGPGCLLQRRGPGDAGARAGDRARLRLRGGGGRPDARRRPRLPRASLRLDGRQPRGGRDRDRRRRDPDRQPRAALRPVLGDPRRRRQPRSRHQVHVPPARRSARPSTAGSLPGPSSGPTRSSMPTARSRPQPRLAS